MSDLGKAVFLSYASQDAEAAKCICEALRAAGVEVWFDQSELRGGDQWDANIRKQIRDCALFVPVISANTQARLEGYFRLEWKLAEDRSHLMAKGKPFIVPVTVDGMIERDAHVPDAFLAVQWTRLAGGEAAAVFGERVKSLLGMEVARAFQPVSSEDTGWKARATPEVGRRVSAAAWGVAAMILVVFAAGGYF